jgi:hypothetical protein
MPTATTPHARRWLRVALAAEREQLRRASSDSHASVVPHHEMARKVFFNALWPPILLLPTAHVGCQRSSLSTTWDLA